MASSARVDGSLPDPGDGSTKGIVFSGGWGVDYEFAGNPPSRANQPRRLSAFGFPAPFDSDLEGALRGRGSFGSLLYLFKSGRYLRLVASTMTPDGPNAEAATTAAWGLPASWTSLDAVVPGRGSKINFCYFLRGTEYVRFDWVANAVSPGYPKVLGTEWQLSSPFNANVDGVIAGQSTLATRGFLFNRLDRVLNSSGGVVPAGTSGSRLVRTPGFARYDFTAAASQGSETVPLEVSSRWGGLLQLLDAGPAIDTALDWCNRALNALNAPTPPTPVLTNALLHHFRTGSPSTSQLNEIRARMTAVRNRIVGLPGQFQWTRGLTAAAQTIPNTLTEIGDTFSTQHGPNGRAAVLTHEAVHFVFVAGGLVIDVPEWSGATIGGQTFGLGGGMAYDAMTPTQAIANPSSYAAFAQEIAFNGNDTRFGDARRHE
jgi:hypothetical protein